MQPISRARAFVAYLCYFILHVGFDSAARLFEASPGISLWYPPAGLALALVAMLGWRAIPAVLVAHLCSGLLASDSPVTWTRFALPLLITVTYALAGELIRRRFGPAPRPTKPLETTMLLAILVLTPAVAALAGSLMVNGAGLVAPGASWNTILNWFIGDLTGVLTVVPVCLVHVAPRFFASELLPPPVWTWQRWLETAGQVLALLGCVGLASGVDALRDQQAFYLCFVPLIWICLRHGLPGATIATCTLVMSSLAALNLFNGPPRSTIDLLLYVLSISGVGLGLGWSVTRRTYVESENSRLLAILEATPDYVGTSDLQGRILYNNAALLQLRGYHDVAQVRGRSVEEWFSPAMAEKVRREALPSALAHGTWQGETAFRRLDGTEVPVHQLIITHRDSAGRPLMISTVARDISRQKEAEQARLESERNLLQAQKLESLGVLAGGIAHDFNNLLTVMLGHASLARLDLATGSAGEQSVHQIELAAFRAANLCKQMLAYSGKGQLTTELLDLNQIVEDTTHLLQVSISKKCALEFSLSRELPPVEGDATQLSQIAMNLVMNASDASHQHGGRILLRTGLIEADQAYLDGTYLALSTTPGRYVYLEVSDQGCGMSPEVQRRVFEPFFTTKYAGHGLGLSAVLGIARGHRGAIKVDSAPGRGTTFRLLLPAASGKPVNASEPAPFDDAWRGSGCVLVVDDEEAVRELAGKMLRRFGFVTVMAGDGREAVDFFRAEPDRFCAVLLDLSMPVMDGQEALREIGRINPSVPVLLMSGYDRTDPAGRSSEAEPAGFVHKPFTAPRLLDALRGALANRAEHAA